MENTSGRGTASVVPPEIDRWNWGAFFLHWIWGIGNSTWLALLMFVPCVGLVMPFVLGARGSAWAWRSRQWESVDAFKATQRRWAIWGAVVWGVALMAFAGLWIAIMFSMKNSVPYHMGVQALNADSEAVQALGQPITTGFASGEIRTASLHGHAELKIPAKGPTGRGTVYLRATRKLGHWEVQEAYLQTDGQPTQIDLND